MREEAAAAAAAAPEDCEGGGTRGRAPLEDSKAEDNLGGPVWAFLEPEFISGGNISLVSYEESSSCSNNRRKFFNVVIPALLIV